MAQSKSFFGLRKGSTKSLTFSVLNGKQVTKDRVVGGKNPRSQAQMVQRMCMATASAAYSAMKQIVDHSFEGYAYGADNMARFISLNTKAIKDNYANEGDSFGYNAYGDRQLKQGAYIMSQGTASPLEYTAKTAFGLSGSVGTSLTLLISNVPEGGVFSADYILNDLGLKVGEMATCVAIIPDAGQPTNTFAFVRFKFVKAGSVALTAANINEYIKMESNFPLVDESDYQNATLKVTMKGLFKESGSVYPNYAWIHSVKSTNGWLRSNTILSVEGNHDYEYNAADALATYPVGDSYILNGGAING